MSVSKLPSGKWRAQIHDSRVGHNVAISQILGPNYRSFATKKEAKAARQLAQEKLEAIGGHGTTVRGFVERWKTEKLFQRPKESTNAINRERIKGFVEKYGDLPLHMVSDQVVAEWLSLGKAHTVPALRAMFNDAASPKAGRLIQSNPFAKLGLKSSGGNRRKNPPSEEMVWALIKAARKSGPSFAAWLQVACFTGMRPGELDALRWESVDFNSGFLHVKEQWSPKTKAFTLPKNGLQRRAILTPPAREALLSLPKQGEFCFVTNRDGTHWTPSSRAYYWKATRMVAGWEGSLYLASRHFFGSYATNVLGLASEDVAFALGHEDGGELVRKLYGHRNQELALQRVAEAYLRAGQVVPFLRAVKDETA